MQDVVLVLAPFPNNPNPVDEFTSVLLHQKQHPSNIPYKFKDRRLLGTASADTQKDRGNGSRLYEVNLWLWCYGRSQPLAICIEEAEAVRRVQVREARSRAEETKKYSREAAAKERSAE